MPCRVTVDAVPNRLFAGRVAKIAVLPDATSWWGNPDLKVYNTEIHIDDGAELRAGMSCRAEIVVETYAQALFVPIQCVVREGGRTVAYMESDGGPAPVPVDVGLDNNSMVRILSGLKRGDRVLLNPPLSGEPLPEEEKGAGGQPAPAAGKEASPAAPAAPSDGRSMTPEERKKRWESLTPEEQAALRERMKRRGDGDGK
jgi:HlyD family secretion protein